jgi:hypothetical protein
VSWIVFESCTTLEVFGVMEPAVRSSGGVLVEAVLEWFSRRDKVQSDFYERGYGCSSG